VDLGELQLGDAPLGVDVDPDERGILHCARHDAATLDVDLSVLHIAGLQACPVVVELAAGDGDRNDRRPCLVCVLDVHETWAMLHQLPGHEHLYSACAPDVVLHARRITGHSPPIVLLTCRSRTAHQRQYARKRHSRPRPLNLIRPVHRMSP